jgi:hypothetical protein
MASRPIAEPVPLTDERLYKQRTAKHMFINPPGHEDAHFVHSFGRSHRDETPWPGMGARDRGRPRSKAEFAVMRERRGMEGPELAKKGPVK